jgi:4'-phosphopantetheinyl transferase
MDSSFALPRELLEDCSAGGIRESTKHEIGIRLLHSQNHNHLAMDCQHKLTTIKMSATPLQLWIAYPVDLQDEREAAACQAILDQEDRARWQGFKFEQHRRESLASRSLVRIALSHGHTVPPQDWRFQVNAHGKPALVPDAGIRFNAANSLDMVVCLIGKTEVGVDVEPITNAASILELAPRVFSTQERAQLDALPVSARSDRALSLWTLKEAYIKSRGLGLALPLEKISFVFSAENVSLEIDPALGDRPENWRFFLSDHAGHRVAGVVARPSDDRLQIFEVRPPLSPPVLLPSPVVSWFPGSI